jgi:hypothetical protein
MEKVKVMAGKADGSLSHAAFRRLDRASGGCLVMGLGWMKVCGGGRKDGLGDYVAVDVKVKDFGKEVSGVDQAGEEDKAEKVLAFPLLQLV